ncbi:MAG: serine--tRNA ligase, partial [Myxococcaceae bacterium]
MLDLKEVSKNFDAVVQRLSSRGGAIDLSAFQRLVAERRELIISVEGLQQKKNQANEEIKRRAKEDPGSIETLRGQMRQVSQEIKAKEPRLAEVEAELEKILLYIPNVPDSTVPVGKSEADNRVERTWGKKPDLLFTPRQHFELGERLGMLDFERAAKVSGSRFAFSKGPLARMERALVAFMIDLHVAKGYLELLPPYLV